MADETSFTLPKLPQLLGEENLEEWKAAIHNHFEWYDILEYLTTEVPEPPLADAPTRKAWKQARLKGKITIHSTLVNKTVRDKLKNSGWNPVDDSNPKAIYELVLRGKFLQLVKKPYLPCTLSSHHPCTLSSHHSIAPNTIVCPHSRPESHISRTALKLWTAYHLKRAILLW
jgi:hypothetical protein